jgi:hypothetical protein
MIVASTLALYASHHPSFKDDLRTTVRFCMMIGGSVGDWSMKQNQNKPLLVWTADFPDSVARPERPCDSASCPALLGDFAFLRR